MSWNNNNSSSNGEQLDPMRTAFPWVRDWATVAISPETIPAGVPRPTIPNSTTSSRSYETQRSSTASCSPRSPPWQSSSSPTDSNEQQQQQQQQQRQAHEQRLKTLATTMATRARFPLLLTPSQTAIGSSVGCTALSVMLAFVHIAGGSLYDAAVFEQAMRAGARLDRMVRASCIANAKIFNWTRGVCGNLASTLSNTYDATLRRMFETNFFFDGTVSHAMTDADADVRTAVRHITRSNESCAQSVAFNVAQQLRDGRLFDTYGVDPSVAPPFLETLDVIQHAVDLTLAPRDLAYDRPYEGVEILTNERLAKHGKTMYMLSVLNSLAAILPEEQYDALVRPVRVYYNNERVYNDAAAAIAPSRDTVRRALASSSELLALYNIGYERLSVLLVALFTRSVGAMSLFVHKETTKAFVESGNLMPDDHELMCNALIAMGCGAMAVFNTLLLRHAMNHNAPLLPHLERSRGDRMHTHWEHNLVDVPNFSSRRPRDSALPGGDLYVDFVAPNIVGPLTTHESVRILLVQAQLSTNKRASLICTANSHTVSVHCWASVPPPTSSSPFAATGATERYVLIDTLGSSACSKAVWTTSVDQAASSIASYYCSSGNGGAIVNARYLSVR